MYKINSDGDQYIGSTNNLRRRAKEHLRNGNYGNSFTFKRTVTKKQASSMENKSIRDSCPSENKLKPDSCKGFWERNFGFKL